MGSRAVIIASSDWRLQDRYVRALRDQRINALGVDTCAELFMLVGAAQTSAVVVDVVTPDDWACYDRIRNDKSMDSIPCIVLTDVAAEDRCYRHMSRRLRCDGFLARTSALLDVLEMVQRVRTGRADMPAE